tara:strand:+ start:8344 stop:10296 length:1953 start_codon:yes stop_codon:yes gene_type:complete
MGAYDNPAIIRDRSAEIYGQLGAIIGTGIAGAVAAGNKIKYDAGIKYQEKVDKFNKEVAGTEARVRIKQTDAMMVEYNMLREKDVSMADQYLQNMKSLMNGVGEKGDKDYEEGTIMAETRLLTSTDLTSEQKTNLTNYVVDTRAYAKNNMTVASLVQGDLEESLKSRVDGKRYVYSGNNPYESMAVQGAFNAMTQNGNVGFPVNADKTVFTNKKGKNGDVNIDIKFAMKKEAFENSEAYQLILANAGIDVDDNEKMATWNKLKDDDRLNKILSMSDEEYAAYAEKEIDPEMINVSNLINVLRENMPKIDDDGDYIFEFKADQNSLKNGFIIDLGEAADPMKVYENANVVDNQGKINKNMFIGKDNPYVFQAESNISDKRQIGVRKFFDINKINSADFDAQAAGVLNPMGNIENTPKVLINRYGIDPRKARIMIEENDVDKLSVIMKNQAEATLMKDSFYVTGNNLTEGEKKYLISNGQSIDSTQKYYFEGKDPTLVAKSTGNNLTDTQYLQNQILKRGRITEGKEGTMRGNLELEDQVQKDIKYLGSFEINAMSKSQALIGMQENMNIYDPTQGRTINTEEDIAQLKASKAVLYVEKNGEYIASTGYDPYDKFGGMLGLISKYGGYDSKTKTNLLNTAARTDNALPIYTD